MKRLSVVAILLLASCARAGAGGSSGIEGRVLLGPQCPVVSEASPCPDEPVATRVHVQTLQGEEVAVVESGRDGRFRVALAPGQYVLVAEVTSGAMFAKPVDVTIPVREFVQVNVLLDTGIREPVAESP
jgi:hypothetical protein